MNSLLAAVLMNKLSSIMHQIRLKSCIERWCTKLCGVLWLIRPIFSVRNGYFILQSWGI